MGSNCEAYKPKNLLPFRRLKEYANGIWDETRKEFYPFLVASFTASNSLAAKKNIHFYVYSASISGENTGDAVAATNSFAGTLRGSSVSFLSIRIGATTAASVISQTSAMSLITSLLFDVNTAITYTRSTTSGTGSIIYAEIPGDPAGGPVIVS